MKLEYYNILLTSQPKLLSFKYHSTTTHVLYPEVSFSNSHVFSPFASSSVFLPHSSSLPIPLLHHQCL